MAKSIENKEEIEFSEFRAWLTGLIRGKRGELPDLQDWKHIKIMMDKVEEGKKHHAFPIPPTYQPPIFIDPPPPTMNPSWYSGYETWCETSSALNGGVKFDIGDLNIPIPELNEPNVGNIENINLMGEMQTPEELNKTVEEFNNVLEEMLKARDEKYGD